MNTAIVVTGCAINMYYPQKTLAQVPTEENNILTSAADFES
jgi:hypothetical protein